MNREDLYLFLYDSPMFKEFHWFQWHFGMPLHGRPEHPFARSVLDACLDCEAVMPGFSMKMLRRLAAITGRGSTVDYREYLFQVLAEILIGRQLVLHPWASPPEFLHEPPAPGSGKRPEFVIRARAYDVGIEVKAPLLATHAAERQNLDIQLVARMPAEIRSMADELGDNGALLPRDNPVKDFLLSANEKFLPFRSTESPRPFFGLLVIVWDDFVNEPLTALVSPESGLFTDNSFARRTDGEPERFDFVDAAIIVRHLHQFARSTQGEPLAYGLKEPLDYGAPDRFPWKVIVRNPFGRNSVPAEIVDALHAITPGRHLGAEYVPGEVIFWVG